MTNTLNLEYEDLRRLLDAMSGLERLGKLRIAFDGIVSLADQTYVKVSSFSDDGVIMKHCVQVVSD